MEKVTVIYRADRTIRCRREGFLCRPFRHKGTQYLLPFEGDSIKMTCTSPSPATLRRQNVPLFRQAFLQEFIEARTLEVSTLDLIVGDLVQEASLDKPLQVRLSCG